MQARSRAIAMPRARATIALRPGSTTVSNRDVSRISRAQSVPSNESPESIRYGFCMTLDLRLVEHAIALAHHRSYARAAKVLHVSQPTLSRRIAGLEESLGVRLFDRGRGGVEPTPFGRVLLERGAALLADEAALRREIQQLAGLEAGELVVGAGPFSAEISVGRAMTRLLAKHPQLRARIACFDPEQIVRDVLAGRCDLGVADPGAASRECAAASRVAAVRTRSICSHVPIIRWPRAPACVSPTCSRFRSWARACAAPLPDGFPGRDPPAASIPTPATSCRPSQWTRSTWPVASRVDRCDPARGARHGRGGSARRQAGPARFPRAVDADDLRSLLAKRSHAVAGAAGVRRGAARRGVRDQRGIARTRLRRCGFDLRPAENLLARRRARSTGSAGRALASRSSPGPRAAAERSIACAA